MYQTLEGKAFTSTELGRTQETKKEPVHQGKVSTPISEHQGATRGSCSLQSWELTITAQPVGQGKQGKQGRDRDGGRVQLKVQIHQLSLWWKGRSEAKMGNVCRLGLGFTGSVATQLHGCGWTGDQYSSGTAHERTEDLELRLKELPGIWAQVVDGSPRWGWSEPFGPINALSIQNCLVSSSLYDLSLYPKK